MSHPRSTDRLVDGVLAGDQRSLARAMSLVENEAAGAEEMLRSVFARTGRAYVVGITGPPGAGKSTLVSALVGEIRATAQTVGVIAVDPSSPFSGGAVLGDRVRMTGYAGDAGVFVRSMATRGHLGGLARTTSDLGLLLDAAGFDVVLIETVGVGQDEIDIVRAADTSVVVFVPGTGDEVQSLKAGIMEIADIFVVNKADRDDADHLVQAIRSALALAPSDSGPVPSVLKTVATAGGGVGELWARIQTRRPDVTRPPTRRRALEAGRVRALVLAKFETAFERAVSHDELDEVAANLAARHTDPYTMAAELYERTLVAARGRQR